MPASFWLPGLKKNVSDYVTEKDLPADVKKHLKSRRVSRGESVLFLAGEGVELHCLCQGHNPPHFLVQSIRHRNRMTPQIHLYLSPPRGDDLWTTLSQATEMGVCSIQFLRSEHGSWLKTQDPPWERARRVVRAACEQSALAFEPKVEANWKTVEEAVGLISHPIVVANEHLAQSQADFGFSNGALAAPLTELSLFVGPEGGWSVQERQLFDTKCIQLGLGSSILRVPTAVVAAIAFLRALR